MRIAAEISRIGKAMTLSEWFLSIPVLNAWKPAKVV